ncbi:MAG: alpha/beta fold hydrolase [bacterium]|nr:alpha/beta fold hydrolase [bacterium]
MPIRSPFACLVLATLLALPLAVLESVYRDEHFVHCQVLVEADTVFSLYTNSGIKTGTGYSENKVVRGALLASPLWQSIKFRLKDVLFKDLRLDFDTRSRVLSIRSCVLQDEYGLDAKQSRAMAIDPLHQVEFTAAESGTFTKIQAHGEDPQLRLSLNLLHLYAQNIQPGFFFTAILLWYPFSYLMLMGVARLTHLARLRRAAQPRGRKQASKLHGWLLAASALIWALAPLAYWAATARYKVLNTPECAAAVPVPTEFQGRELVLKRPDGLEIAGRLYQNEEQVPVRGNILLLHGNYPQGQMFPLYPLLAESLAERGFRVLSIDFAGFGRSADPFASEAFFRSDLDSETQQAITYLKSLAKEGAKLSIIGHSMGANPALRVGLDHPAVDALILIGPPRRVADRFHHRGDLAFFWNWALGIGKSQYGREQFPSWYTQEKWQAYFLEHDMVHLLPRLRAWGHKPLYLLDGGGEPAEDLAFLRGYAGQVSAPCTYLTLTGADHNVNVLAFQKTPIYDPPALEQALDVLETWCEKEEGPGDPAWSWAQNGLRMLFPFR